MTTSANAATRRLLRRAAILVVALFAATVSAVAGSQTAASASPIANSVNQTAYIWNCPTGAPGCYPGAQTRVGDVRVGDPIADLCAGTFGGNQKNLIFNQTARSGAAERTGFLYRSTLSSKDQRDSCHTGGVGHSVVDNGANQRLCPYDSCGTTGTVPRNNGSWVLREFCFTYRSNVDWRLVVAYNTTTNGPLTAGFVRASQLDNPLNSAQYNCDFI